MDSSNLRDNLSNPDYELPRILSEHNLTDLFNEFWTSICSDTWFRWHPSHPYSASRDDIFDFVMISEMISYPIVDSANHMQILDFERTCFEITDILIATWIELDLLYVVEKNKYAKP